MLKALLLKDLLQIKKRSLIMLIAVVFFLIIGGVQGNLVNCLLATMIPLMLAFTTLAYDQNDGWDTYTAATPCKRSTFVQSKYVMALLTIAVTIVLLFLISLIAGRHSRRAMVGNGLAQMTFGLLFVSINYPLIFKVGFEKSRVYYILVTMVLMSITGAFASRPTNRLVRALEILLPALSIIALVLSYIIAKSIMESKEFTES